MRRDRPLESVIYGRDRDAEHRIPKRRRKASLVCFIRSAKARRRSATKAILAFELTG
jgi:hypothetical protein